MDVREKLVELQDESDICPEGITSCIGCKYHNEYAFGNPCDVKSAIADKMIAHGVTVQEWISVKDRLPESGKDVLVITSNIERNMAVWRFFQCTPNGRPHWEDEVGDGLILEAATHWMPLPEPPKED